MYDFHYGTKNCYCCWYHVELTKFSQKQSNSSDVKILLGINKEGRLSLTGRQLLSFFGGKHKYFVLFWETFPSNIFINNFNYPTQIVILYYFAKFFFVKVNHNTAELQAALDRKSVV